MCWWVGGERSDRNERIMSHLALCVKDFETSVLMISVEIVTSNLKEGLGRFQKHPNELPIKRN